MIEALGDRDGFLCREATKLHEEYVRGPLSALRERLAARGAVKGEIVLVVAGAPDKALLGRGSGGALPPARGGRPHPPRSRQGSRATAGVARARGVRAGSGRGSGVAQPSHALSSSSVVRGVVVVLEVVEGCKREDHDAGWKRQAPHASQGLRPIRRDEEEQARWHERDDR